MEERHYQGTQMKEMQPNKSRNHSVAARKVRQVVSAKRGASKKSFPLTSVLSSVTPIVRERANVDNRQKNREKGEGRCPVLDAGSFAVGYRGRRVSMWTVAGLTG